LRYRSFLVPALDPLPSLTLSATLLAALRSCRAVQRRQRGRELRPHDLLGPSGVEVLLALAHADDDAQPGRVRRRRLARDLLVRLVE